MTDEEYLDLYNRTRTIAERALLAWRIDVK